MYLIAPFCPCFRIFHCTLLITALTIIVSIFFETKSLTLFSLHPICMSIGSLIFLGEGIVAYRNNGLLETLSPIMQHSKRTKVRSIHQTMQMIGAAFLSMGLLIIVANKIEFNKSILPMTTHSFIGAFAMALILVQVVSGQQKLHQIDVSNSKIRRWHGDAGLLIWDFLCLSILSGLVSFLSMNIGTLLVECTVVAAWVAVHSQMSNCARPNASRGALTAGVVLSGGEDDSDGPNNIDNDFVDLHFDAASSSACVDSTGEEGRGMLEKDGAV